MKKRLAILNFALLAAILSSIVFQSVHSFEHMVESYSEKHCLHPNDDGKPQITHQHKNFDHCFTCGFGLSNFIAPEIFVFKAPVFQNNSTRFFFAAKEPYFFSGISYQLRGPPSV